MLRQVSLSSVDIQTPNVLFHGLSSEISSGMFVSMVTQFCPDNFTQFFHLSSSACSSHLCYDMNAVHDG